MRQVHLLGMSGFGVLALHRAVALTIELVSRVKSGFHGSLYSIKLRCQAFVVEHRERNQKAKVGMGRKVNH